MLLMRNKIIGLELQRMGWRPRYQSDNTMILYCYCRYLQSLLEYMESYVHRIKPLLDIQQVSVFHPIGQPTRY